MKLTIPLYVCQHRGQYTVRPLFFAEPTDSDPRLEHALQHLTRTLREQLHRLGEQLRHDEFARHAFAPPLEYHRIEVPIALRRQVVRIRLLFVVLRALGRRIAFTPALPGLWFELPSVEHLADRAAEVLSAHFRRRESEDGEDFVRPEEYALGGTAWVSDLEIEITPAQLTPDADDANRLFLGTAAPVSGEEELFRVARCLDHLYPDDLDRVILRERELGELTRLLDAADRRPLLLVGPPLVGKTALLHEYVYRSVQRRTEKHLLQNLTWLLAPQRLISGMSYVGQWENRLLAILKEADRRNHLLYFDNVLGLYQAGITSQSDLSAAHVLRPYIERREVRLLAEMTPEALRVFRERDRGFADLFHILPVREPTEAENLRILIHTQRQLEARHRCRFAIDALPAAIDLQRRYARHVAFPGKAALFLRRLAVKAPDKAVGRAEVLADFQAKSGLRLAFLDDRARLERDEVLAALRRQIIGQDAALGVAADVVSIARARLNEPDRPLAALLFLGPTGVGKTQTAKALARYLFGDADRLLRFDMNEFLTPGSAARLVGTFDQPEGLLTAAVRRQPFAVVLLDEIEKAHGEVFDLLLQVLGEGRLTDAHGRLTDFSNAIVILTSNLGVREAGARVGFGGETGSAAYSRAAERFFRPEFFNRLDRIVPFERLGRDDVGRIAELLMHDVLQREGLVRRKCVLRVEAAALERIIDTGYDPQLGARALKRAIERCLTQPVARRLAEGLPETMTLIHLFPSGSDIGVRVDGLTQVDPVPPPPDFAEQRAVIAAVRAVADRALAQVDPLRPTGAITAATASQYAQYFQVKELASALRELAYRHQERLDSRRTIGAHAAPPDSRSPRITVQPTKRERGHDRARRVLQELAAAQDIQLYLQHLVETAGSEPDGYGAEDGDADAWDVVASGRLPSLAGMVRRAVLLHAMTDSLARGEPAQALVVARAENAVAARWLAMLPLFARGRWAPGIDIEEGPRPTDAALERTAVLRGLPAVSMARSEAGTHVFCPQHGALMPIEVRAVPVPDTLDPAEVYRAQCRRGALDELPPVVRIYHEDGKTIDLRTGIASPRHPRLAELVLAALPLPPELAAG